MSSHWLNLFLRFSGHIFILKQKIVEAPSWPRALYYVGKLLLVELIFLAVSFPLYLAVSPKKLQETGFIFPSKEKEDDHLRGYIVRRKISLTTVFGAGGVFLIKFVFIGLVSAYLLGAQTLLAATQDWTFDNAVDYSYDSAKIEITGGTARLKATVVSASGATTNPDFSTNSNGWTYADWDQGGGEVNIAGTRVANGGNPGGYIQVSAPAGKDDELGGYWRQEFATTVANPTATVNFDWRVTGYDSTPAPITFKLYVFVDTGIGVPVIGQEVWSSGSITGTGAWASVSGLDISSKVTTAGTYYLKAAMWVETPSGPGNSGAFTVGFDNVLLNWSKTTTTYDSGKPTIAPVNSLSDASVMSWTSFTETATKNGGEIYYQLSDDDGATWQFWDGEMWVLAGSGNYNTASVVNTNIVTFSVANRKIMWKAFLESDGSQQVVLDTISINYSQNSPPTVQNVNASQDTDTGLVFIDYVLVDANSDTLDLVNYEYSLTGAFAGEQEGMTPASSDPSHEGISGLTSSPGGTAHTFAWNAQADLGDVIATVFVRLRANDGIANSAYSEADSVEVDYVDPAVSNAVAVQPLGNADIQITYDLFDDTEDGISVELDVSNDGGETWTVPVSSVNGAIGSSVNVGTGKTIVWDAGTDFSGQEQNDMMARVRAVDKYQNQSNYANSDMFALDNSAPVITVPVNLLAQPLAGATTVLVGGAFSEGNPDTNYFYVAINGNDYGSAQAGDAGTATPSDKEVSVEKTLNGADYISAVKIEHTDDFDQITSNENNSPNSAYKYVKPFTPPPPTVGNPTEETLDVSIHKHSSEVEGLEYAIFEDSQNLYVQGDGSLASEPYWHQLNTITVTGLVQPVSQYIFKVKSRNSSDSGHSAASESEYSSGASSDYQSPNIEISSVAQTTDGSKQVNINYFGTDYQDHVNNLIKYEYSLDNSGWQAMTEKSGAESDGVIDLPFNSGSQSFTFVWDVGLDLPNTEDSSVYVRLQSNDSITDSNVAVSAAFAIDTAGPAIANLSATQTASTDNVSIQYDLTDNSGAGNMVVLALSSDSGATFDVPITSATGDIGSVVAGAGREIIWNAGVDFADQENSTMKARLSATDSFGNAGETVDSTDFAVDTLTPTVVVNSVAQAAGSALVDVNYNLADLSACDVSFEISSDNGATWDVPVVTYSGEVGAGQTAGDRIFQWNAVEDFPDQELVVLKMRLQATDEFGHVSDYAISSDFEVNTRVLSIANISAVQDAGARAVTVVYDLNTFANVVEMQVSADGGATWEVSATSLTGDIGASVSSGDNKTIVWDAGADFNNEEQTDMRVRLRGEDGFGAVSAYYESADFSVDTAAPLGLLSFSKFAATDDSVTMNWSSGILDASFSHYELWHGSSRDDVLARSGTAVEWSVAQDENLNSINTISTVITGLNLENDYFVKIWAVDGFGNESTFNDLNVSTFAPEPITYGLTIEPSEGDGLVDPDVGVYSYDEGTGVVINAYPTNGWYFSRWLLDNVAGGSENPLTLFMNATHTLQAIFAEGDAPSPSDGEVPPESTGVSGAIADIDPPTKPILSSLNTPTANTLVLISGLAEPNSRVNLYDKEILIGNIAVNNEGQFNQEFTFAAGEHVFVAQAVDAAGNVSEFSDVVSLNILIELPLAPVVLVPANGASLTEAVLTLVGAAQSLIKIEIVLDGINKFETTANLDGAWQFNLPNSFALTDGVHTFALIAVDAADNRSAETVLTVTKVTPVPVTAPGETGAGGAPISASEPALPTPIVEAVTPAIPPVSLIRESIGTIELAGIPTPKIDNASVSVAGGVFTFTGTALPSQEVLVYVNSEQALIYRAKADQKGAWMVNHDQNSIELAPGDHHVFAVAVDTGSKVRSKPSAASAFTVEKNFWVSAFESLNLRTTIITLVFLLFTTLWLYRIKKRETTGI